MFRLATNERAESISLLATIQHRISIRSFNNAFELFVKLAYQFLFYDRNDPNGFARESTKKSHALTLILARRIAFDSPAS